jgi:hypothetical protein
MDIADVLKLLEQRAKEHKERASRTATRAVAEPDGRWRGAFVVARWPHSPSPPVAARRVRQTGEPFPDPPSRVLPCARRRRQ